MKKNIIIGITGSVAAYKSAQLVSDLLKLNYEIDVIMTNSATKFIQPMTFEALTKKPVYIDLFNDGEGFQIKHIELAKKADAFVVIPASANTISKLANGIANDMLSTTFLASNCPKLIAPAMNTGMYDNLATQRNIERCKSYGINFIEPENGLLACGDIGRGKLANLDDVIENIEALFIQKTLKNKKVLVTAGPTIEAIDPVRYITNHASGKMGYSIAKKAFQMGADVTLISGPTNIKIPFGVNCINVSSADSMFNEIKEIYKKQDFIIKTAAVGDYKSNEISVHKIKKNNTNIQLDLVKNIDILNYLGENKSNQLLCGFAMETENLIDNAHKKFKNKNCDLLIANDLKNPNAGFKIDTNQVSFITKDSIQQKDVMTKDELAYEILNTLQEMER